MSSLEIRRKQIENLLLSAHVGHTNAKRIISRRVLGRERLRNAQKFQKARAKRAEV